MSTGSTVVAVVGMWVACGAVLVARGRAHLGVHVLGASALGAVVAWAAGGGRVWVALVVAAIATAWVAFAVRRDARDTSTTERSRLQLVAASVLVGAAVALVAGAIALGASSDVAEAVFWLAFTVPAFGVAAGCFAGARRNAARAVRFGAAAVSLAAVVIAGQMVAVLVAGRLPEGDERAFVAPSFLGATIAAFAIAPVRRAGDALTGRWLLGARRRPDDAAKTLTERASQGVPVDELLLQLAESLRSAFAATRVEVWTRPTESFELSVAVPDRGATPIRCSAAEVTALSRVSVAGDTWLSSWTPRLLSGRDGAQVRVAPAVHTATVLGLVVVERNRHDVAFSEADDRALADIGRRLGEVLNARRLDAALTATLDDLRASRARLVAAADAERRRIERNLHDGAQQHLVALAVSLRLARDLVRDDPEASAELLDELSDDVRDTIDQLRDLAHGIYPPLLIDSGLAEALRAAGRRSPQPVEVDADVDRHPVDVEAAVYFCCLEALQNAAKHAPDAAVRMCVRDTDGVLRFEVVDDGPGFDPSVSPAGHGFQNMADRLGAIGGRVSWDSAPGRGTRVVGEVEL